MHACTPHFCVPYEVHTIVEFEEFAIYIQLRTIKAIKGIQGCIIITVIVKKLM